MRGLSHVHRKYNTPVIERSVMEQPISPNIIRVNLTAIRFEKEFYTRIDSQSPAKVQEYATSIAEGNFPPILLNHEDMLLDGWHRWKAAQEAGLEDLPARVLNTTGMDKHEIRRKSASANMRHGLPQTEPELKKLIRDEYKARLEDLDQPGRESLKKAMALDYSRSLDYIRDTTSRIDKDHKAELRETAFKMWMACATQEAIAEAVGYSRQAIGEFLEMLQNAGNTFQPVSGISSENDALTSAPLAYAFEDQDEDEDVNRLGIYQLDPRLLVKANHLDEYYKPPIYNIWKQQHRSQGITHPGNSEEAWLDHLLYLYTQPFDIVIDPFAGSGSTIDLCKTRLRRYFVSDRKPIDIRDDIRLHDLTDGILSPPAWKTVKLIYLDPPYWKQVEGAYSDDATDLANMSLEHFTETLADLIKQYAEKLKRARVEHAVIALLMQPTQWRAPEHTYTDHVADMLRLVKLPLDMRFSVPYESQQCTAQMVDWAKANRQCLVLTRELVVWRVN
jgi:biotin operon repressor